ncbi:1-aminocyclopropane-1-carboxylate oxidase-like protein, partial [Thalictrum thalictroides]
MDQTLPELKSDHDRKKELLAFDNTKAGVKGLVDDGVAKIPQIFIHPQDDDDYLNEKSSSSGTSIPFIDLKDVENDISRRNIVVEEVLRASESGGFFQVLNHGIPITILDEMIEGVKRFNEQPQEVRSQYYNRDYATKKVVYNSNFDLYQTKASGWRDTFLCSMAPYPPSPDELPETC